MKRTQKAGNIISREFEVLHILKGQPYVVQLYDLFYSVDSSNRVIQNAVMEFCDKNLEDVIEGA